MGVKKIHDVFYNFNNESGHAWKWLRNHSKYIAAYKKQTSHIKNKTEPNKMFKRKCHEKWGFYPLIDPAEHYEGVTTKHGPSPSMPPPLEFTLAMMKRFRIDLDCIIPVTITSIDLNLKTNRTETQRYKKRHGINPKDILPKLIDVRINPRKKISIILEELKDYMKRVQKAYGVTKPESQKLEGFGNRYKLFVLRNLGHDESEIKKQLKKEFIAPNCKTESDSRAKSINRLIKKYPQKPDKK